jgi:uncharacterized membrane protein YgcG
LEIKMFAPSNLQTSSRGKQRASTKDGYLEIEMNDSFGDLNSTWDVVMAWMSLAAIWQKLFPDWPVAIIGLRTIFTMKLFQHCGDSDKKMMVEYSNKFLKANSLRAANKQSPMDFERSKALAGSVCHGKGFEREAPATRLFNQQQQKQPQQQQQGPSSSQTSNSDRGGASGGRGRGGRGGGSVRPSGAGYGVTLADGTKVCNYWQTGTCKEQNLSACDRNGYKYKHVCAFIKTGGQVCGRADHKRPEHDPAKH